MFKLTNNHKYYISSISLIITIFCSTIALFLLDKILDYICLELHKMIVCDHQIPPNNTCYHDLDWGTWIGLYLSFTFICFVFYKMIRLAYYYKKNKLTKFNESIQSV